MHRKANTADTNEHDTKGKAKRNTLNVDHETFKNCRVWLRFQVAAWL